MFWSWRRRSNKGFIFEARNPPLQPSPTLFSVTCKGHPADERCDIRPFPIFSLSLSTLKDFWMKRDFSLSHSLRFSISTSWVAMATEQHRWRPVSPLYIYSVAVATTQACTKEEEAAAAQTSVFISVTVWLFCCILSFWPLVGGFLHYLSKFMWTHPDYASVSLLWKIQLFWFHQILNLTTWMCFLSWPTQLKWKPGGVQTVNSQPSDPESRSCAVFTISWLLMALSVLHSHSERICLGLGSDFRCCDTKTIRLKISWHSDGTKTAKYGKITATLPFFPHFSHLTSDPLRHRPPFIRVLKLLTLNLP